MAQGFLADENGVILQKLKNIDRVICLDDGDRILRKGTLEYLNDTTDIKYHFIKINPKIFDKYCKKYSILPYLTCHIGYMDNICCYDNGKIIQLKDLPKVCEVSETTIKRQLKGLIADDIIHKVPYKKNQKCLMINPYLAMRGKRIYLSTYNEFKLSALRNEVEE
jgi:hypothetical protein|nr:MAG TPA: ethanolamine utilization protein [Bacteriophage sp.]